MIIGFGKKDREILAKLAEDQQEIKDNVVKTAVLSLRNDSAINEISDILEEKSALEKEMASELEEYRRNIDELIKLITLAEEQFSCIAEFQSEPEQSRQLEMLSRERKKLMLGCGLTAIDEKGVPVDYDIHEVLEVRNTRDEVEDSLIAEIINPGLVYKGKTVTKAKVAAFRFSENNEE